MSIALVTCMFNPCDYARRYENYKLFAEGVRVSGCHLYCVELTFGKQVPRCTADAKIDLSGDDRNLLWQKEALLNIGLQSAVDNGHEFVGWTDADVILPTGWHDRLSEQFGDDASKLLHLGKTIVSEWSDREAMVNPSAVLHLAEPFAYRGHPGGGWIARREFWQTHPLFDRCIVGGGDWALFCGYALQAGGSPTCELWAKHHPQLAAAWNVWRDTLPALQLDTLPQTVRLLAHGPLAKRRYQSRPGLLRGVEQADVRLRSDGVLEWATDKPELHTAIRRYFFGRREDE